MTTDAIEWGEPPPDGRSRNGAGRLREFVSALRARPGEWARYPRALSHAAAWQNARNYPGTEWTTRKRDDGKCDIYARWIGETT